MISQPALTIPTYVTEMHNENFRYWMQLRNATMFRIDAHDDFSDYVPYQEVIDGKYYRRLTIGNFNCAAVHYGIVSNIYWLNPLKKERRLLDMGSNKDSLRTFVGGGYIKWVNGWGRFKDCLRIIRPDQIMISENPFILDIDLDGFCCIERGYDAQNFHHPNHGWEQRVDETAELVRGLKRPDVITITRSQGEADYLQYVPLGLVDDVQARTLEKLAEIYGGGR